MSLCSLGSYYLKAKTPLLIRLLISYLSNALNNTPRVVILPSFRSLRASSKSAYSLFVRNAIDSSTLFINWLARSLSFVRYTLFYNPFGRPWPLLISWLVNWSLILLSSTIGSLAIGSLAIGSLTIGSLAIGSLAIGSLAIGSLSS